MSTDFTFRVLIIGILSICVMIGAFLQYDREDNLEGVGNGGQNYLPIVSGQILPFVFLMFFMIGLMFYGMRQTLKTVLGMCFGIFLHISLYYLVLMMTLPFFRKRISARACATLWLLPNFLYLLWFSRYSVAKPLVTIHVSKRLVTILFAVWLLGFAAVFSWNIIRHLLFRREILRHAVPVTDPEVLQLFQTELEEIAFRKPKFSLVMTDDVSTPLTIGLYQRKSNIVLPRKDYSPDELHLIFRHELIHISRADSWTKFFMVFCTAMCWFNPLMWLAMKKSAQDVELSCDETVLLCANERTRNQYANLILSAAGDDRGFSTCLSASVTSMRYRLKNIVHPKKRHTGILSVGLTFFIVYLTYGYVSLAYGDDTGATTVFRGNDLSEFVVDSVLTMPTGGSYIDDQEHMDAEALTRYLAELPTQDMTGNYSYSNDQYLSVWYDSPYGVVVVQLGTDFLKVDYWDDKIAGLYVYHLPQPTDWDYIDSILQPLPEAAAGLPEK